jgi:uncharacterized protein with PIN domain
MPDSAVFEYLRWIPAILGLIAVWIVIGSIGVRIARSHAVARSTRECPRCQAELKAVGRGFRNRVVASFFLVDIARYACRQCGFRQSVWQA